MLKRLFNHAFVLSVLVASYVISLQMVSTHLGKKRPYHPSLEAGMSILHPSILPLEKEKEQEKPRKPKDPQNPPKTH